MCDVDDPAGSIEEQKLNASDAATYDHFGSSVSASGDTALVGAIWHDCKAGTECGSAYVFRFDGTSWIEEQKLTASDAAGGDVFGWSVSIDGDTAIVGARMDDCAAGTNCGSAYVFRFDGTSWIQEQKLTATDAAANDGFGASVSVSGGIVIVGAYLDDCADGSDCGSAYVFRFNGTSWFQEQKLIAADAAAADAFGWSVSIDGDTAIVGAPGHSCAAGPYCGSAYVFTFNGTSWVEKQKLTGDNAFADFGVSVSVSGDTALLGADGISCVVGVCSIAYLFRFDGTSWIQEQELAPTTGTSRGGGKSNTVSPWPEISVPEPKSRILGN